MARWEYRVQWCNYPANNASIEGDGWLMGDVGRPSGSPLQERLEYLGNQGWELVGIQPSSFPIAYSAAASRQGWQLIPPPFLYIFKKEK